MLFIILSHVNERKILQEHIFAVGPHSLDFSFDFIKEWANIHKIAIGTSNEEIIANSKVIERIQVL
jgi:hypothetical protein